MLKYKWMFNGGEVKYTFNDWGHTQTVTLENNSYDTQYEAIEALKNYIDDIEINFGIYTYDVKDYFDKDLLLVQYYKIN
jgi:hypothetical protein